MTALLAAVLPLASPALAAADPPPPNIFAAGGVPAAPGWSSTAYFYTSSKNTPATETNANTNVHVGMSGGVGVLEYGFPWLRLAVIGTVGQTHVTYMQVLQDTYADSKGLGFRASADVGPLVFTLGASGARNKYVSVLQNSIDKWDGSEREIHATVASRFNVAGPVWFAPLAGFRHLDLVQDAHLLGASIIPRETDVSRLLFVGTKLEFEVRDQLNNLLRPWLFGGFTHEYKAQAPLGPSVFFAEQVAGNQFTLFPQGTSGVPTVFPSRDTQVFGVGMDVEFWKTVTINGAFYREFNAAFDSVNMKFGAIVKW